MATDQQLLEQIDGLPNITGWFKKLKTFLTDIVISKAQVGPKVYRAKIFMADGSATVYENTLGVSLTWTASVNSIQTQSVAQLIGQNNVFVSVTSGAYSSNPKIVSGNFTPSPWKVDVQQINDSGNGDLSQQVYIEILVYP